MSALLLEEDALAHNAQSHTPLHSASLPAGHEIQQGQQVGASMNPEPAVQISEGATVWPSCPQRQQLRQQQAERQCEQQAVKPLRNVSGKRKTYKHLFEQLCDYDNLLLAFIKARKRKTKKEYVQRFEANLRPELLRLQWELLTGIYKPAPMTMFTVRDPKTRKISASHFRDRVVHHAICNLIEPIFESRFIFDTFANRKRKGTKAILQRFDKFKRKAGPHGFALKADIRKYFENVDHQVLLSILGKRIKDQELLRLISLILQNYRTETPGKGMPLGNLTSQFFANIYLGELDNFVKHELRAKFYLRYVDDFVLLGKNRRQMQAWKESIGIFLQERLRISLHPDKTKIVRLQDGVSLVGLRIFTHHKLLKKSNLRRVRIRLEKFREQISLGQATPEHVQLSMAGWGGYAKQADTFMLRQEITKTIEIIEAMPCHQKSP